MIRERSLGGFPLFDGPLDAIADLIQGLSTPDLTLSIEGESSTQSITPRDNVAPTITITSGPTRDEIRVEDGMSTLEQSLDGVKVSAAGPEVPFPDASATAAGTASSPLVQLEMYESSVYLRAQMQRYAGGMQ